MDRADFNNLVTEMEKEIKSDILVFEMESVDTINQRLQGNDDILNKMHEEKETTNPDIEGLLNSHSQLEAVKNVISDPELNLGLDDETKQNFMDKIGSLEKICNELEEKYEVFKVESKPDDIVNDKYMKINFDVTGFDKQMNFDTLCEITGVPKGSDSIHRFGTTNVYAKNGTYDKDWEIKLIPATVEGRISPFAVGKYDMGNGRELLFVGNIAVNEKGYISPRIENIHFIGTDGADKHIPEYMKDDTGRCTSFDLTKGELNKFIPHKNNSDGKIDVNASYDNVTYDLFKRTGLQIVNNTKYGLDIRNDDLYALKNDCINLKSNADIATKTLAVTLSKDLVDGPKSLDDTVINSDTLIKVSEDRNTLTDVTKGFDDCITKVKGLNAIAERLVNNEGNPEFVCNELSLYLGEAVKIRNDVAKTFEKYSDYVDTYKAANNAGITKEECMHSILSTGIEMYNSTLDNTNKDVYDAQSLHIGNKGFVYDGTGTEATERMPSKENQTCSDENPTVQALDYGHIEPMFPAVGDSILSKNTEFKESDLIDSAKNIVNISETSFLYAEYLVEKGMSRKDAANEVEALRQKYLSLPEGIEISPEEMIERINSFKAEIESRIDAKDVDRKEDDKQEVVKDNENGKTTKEKAKERFDKISKEIDIQAKKLGRLAHGDIFIIGMSVAQAYFGLIAGEEKYHIKSPDGDTSNDQIGYYSTADILMSSLHVLTASPNAICMSALYRVLDYVCTRTIDVAIRNLVDNGSDKTTNDDNKTDKPAEVESKEEDGVFISNDSGNDSSEPVATEEDLNKNDIVTKEEPKNEETIQPEGDNTDDSEKDISSNENDNESIGNNPELDVEGDDTVSDTDNESDFSDIEFIDADEDYSGYDFTKDDEDIKDDVADDNEQPEMDNNKDLEQKDVEFEEDDVTSDKQNDIDNSDGTDDVSEQDDGNVDNDTDDTEHNESDITTNADIGDEDDNDNIKDTDTLENDKTNTDELMRQDMDIQFNEAMTDNQPESMEQTENNLMNTDKENLIENINDVLDGTKTMEEAGFNEYFEKNPAETMDIMTDTLSDRLIEAADSGEGIEDAINNVADFITNISNPANYDNADSIEIIAGNISKKNKDDVNEKLYSALESLAVDPTINTDIDTGIDEQEDINKKDNEEDSVSFDMDGHKVEVDIFKTDDGIECIKTIDNVEVPDETIDESIERTKQEVCSDVDPIVTACTSDDPVEKCIDDNITFDMSIITKDDLINALESIKENLPKVLQYMDIIEDPEKAINNAIINQIEKIINDVIADVTGVDIKGTIDEFKHDVAEKLCDSIKDVFSSLLPDSNADFGNNVDTNNIDIGNNKDVLNDTEGLADKGIEAAGEEIGVEAAGAEAVGEAAAEEVIEAVAVLL